MSECTKGKIEVVENAFRQKTLIREVGCNVNIACCNDETTSHIPLETQEANAKELVRRWNAFEDGGLVEELRDALKGLMKAWWGTGDCRSMHQLKTDMDAAYDIAEDALAKS